MHTSELDHNVHLEGLSSPKTADILKDDNTLFERLIAAIDDDTLLLATSDHGLIESGHGGISAEERASFLFAYRRKGLLRSHPFMEKHFPYEIASDDIDNFDLTPTLSLLVNNAPPFNAIGDLLTEVLPLPENASHLDLARHILTMRKEVLDQKIKLAHEVKEINKEHHELLDNMLTLANKTDRLLKKNVTEDNEEDYINDCVSVIKQMKYYIGLFKEFTSTRATKYDLGSAKTIMVSAILGLAATIWQTVMLFSKEKSTLCFNLGFRAVGVSILVGILLARLLQLKYAAGIFASYSLAIFLVIFFEQLKMANLLKVFMTICHHLRLSLGYNRTGIVLLAGFVTYRIVENNNCVMTEHPLHSLFFLKVLLDYMLNTISIAVVGTAQKHGQPTMVALLRRFMYIAAEIILFYLLSLGDMTLLGTFKSSLNDGYRFIEDNKTLVGTFVPGSILLVLTLHYMTRVYRFNKTSIGLFAVLFIASLLCVHFAEVDLFWGRQVVPLKLLGMTLYSMYFNFKSNKHLTFTKYHQFLIILVSIIPLVLLVGSHFSAYNTLLQFALIALSFKYEKKPSIYLMMNCFIITRMSFYGAGQRLTLNGICLNCGTLFYNDYHFMSWLVVTVKTLYPYIMGSLFYLVMVLRYFHEEKTQVIARHSPKSEQVSAKSTPTAWEETSSAVSRLQKETLERELDRVKSAGASWVFSYFMMSNALSMSDALGNSILFTVDSTNVMIYQASSTYLYQFQIFAWLACLKFLFCLLK